MKAATFLLKALKSEHVDTVFMVPGGLLDPFLGEFGEKTGVKALVASHEAGAAYMADGYARASGRFGVCFGIGGPGVLNMMGAIAAAYADQSPMLVVTGQVQTSWEGRGAFQDASPGGLNDIEVLRPVTNYVQEVRDATSLSHNLYMALRASLSYRRGPSCLSIPKQVQSEELKDEYRPLPPSMVKPPRFVVEGGIRFAADKALGATKIAILAGDGAVRSEATKELIKFAEDYRIPVATTLKAKGVFPEDHALSLGVFGYAGTRHAAETLMSGEVEVLIVLGSSLNQRDTMVWSPKMMPKKVLIQVDMNHSTFGRNFPVDIPVTGDVRTALRAFMEQDNLTQSLVDTAMERETWVKEAMSGPRRYDEDTRVSDAVPLHPARVLTDLREFAPRDTVLLIDSGAHRAFAGHHWDCYGPNEYISSNTLAPMGWAIPAGIGAKFARPDQAHVVVTGDGCMLMHGIEIQAAAHNGIKLIVLVLNNAALGNVYLRAENDMAKEITTLGCHDWVEFSKSLGGDGMRVETPDQIKPAFEKAFAAEGVFVLDMRTDPHFKTPITPWSQAKNEEKACMGYAQE